MAVSEPSFIGKTNLRFWNVGTFVIFIVLITSFGCQSLCFCTLMGSSSDLCDRIFFGSINSFHHVGIKRFHYFSLHWKGQSLFYCILRSIIIWEDRRVVFKSRINHRYHTLLFISEIIDINYQLRNQKVSLLCGSNLQFFFLTVLFAYSIRDRFVQVLQLDRFKQVL